MNVLNGELVEEDDPTSRVGYGWHVGVVAGAAVAISPSLSLMLELGWIRHDVNHAIDQDQLPPLAQDVPDLGLAANQLMLNVGAAFGIGG